MLKHCAPEGAMAIAPSEGWLYKLLPGVMQEEGIFFFLGGGRGASFFSDKVSVVVFDPGAGHAISYWERGQSS